MTNTCISNEKIYEVGTCITIISYEIIRKDTHELNNFCLDIKLVVLKNY